MRERPVMTDYRRLLVRIARLYHDHDLTQEEIASRLRLSRQKVQRLLQEAKKLGVVQVVINPVIGTFAEMEEAVEERFGLSECVIVETTDYHNQAVVAREVGTAAADYLLRVARSNDTILMNWGNSLLAMVNALARVGRAEVKGRQVIQALGGLGDPNHETHAGEVVRRAARALGAQAVLLPAPALAGSTEAAAAYREDPYVTQVLARARQAKLAFVGIGAATAESVMVLEFLNLVRPATLALLKKRGAVGSINLRYFDQNGRVVSGALENQIIGLTLDELNALDRVVGVAGGATKFEAIQGALRGRLVKVLVTDHLTARGLVGQR